jgi:hypothetical protein
MEFHHCDSKVEVASLLGHRLPDMMGQVVVAHRINTLPRSEWRDDPIARADGTECCDESACLRLDSGDSGTSPALRR